MGHVSGLNHIAIFVSDLEPSRHFYHDLPGLPIVEFGERTAGIPELSGVPGGCTREYRLGVPRPSWERERREARGLVERSGWFPVRNGRIQARLGGCRSWQIVNEIILDTPIKMEYYAVWSYGMPHTVSFGNLLP